MSPRIKVIVNPAAGQAEPILNVLNQVFHPAGIDWDVSITQGACDAADAARQAGDLGFDLIGVYGGDGTVSEVAEALVGGGPPILLLPGGTGNVFAEELGIPRALADAAALAVGDAGELRAVDLGNAAGRRFTTRLTMGLEAKLVNETTREKKDRLGWLAYTVAGLQALADPPSAIYRLTVDAEEIEIQGVAAIIANSASTGVAGMRIAEGVDATDGLLDVLVVQSTDLGTLLGSAADMAQGQEPRGMSRWRGTRIRVESDPVQSVVVDGEDTDLTTPVDVSVEPGAVRFVVPRAG